MPDQITIRVQRQDRPDSRPYTEEFVLPYQPNMNVISCLQELAARPITAEGRSSTPIVYDSNCLENVCGSCTMVINGRVRQACNTLIDNLLTEQPVVDLQPMTKFAVVRDLMVNRQRMFESLKRVRAWIPVDTYGFVGGGPVQSPETQEITYPLSCCMTCGCCMEVCPQIGDRSDFIGPAPIGQAVLFNLNPTGRMTAAERIEALMGPGGISDCGNAQNCVKVCPKEVPLTWAIGKMGREATINSIRRFLLK